MQGMQVFQSSLKSCWDLYPGIKEQRCLNDLRFMHLKRRIVV